jgi:uncharacterized protein
MKYLLLLLVVGVVWWALSSRRGGLRGPTGAASANKKENMVACAHCGVHLPLSEAVADGTHVYCNDAHRLAGPARPGA